MLFAQNDSKLCEASASCGRGPTSPAFSPAAKTVGQSPLAVFCGSRSPRKTLSGCESPVDEGLFQYVRSIPISVPHLLRRCCTWNLGQAYHAHFTLQPLLTHLHEPFLVANSADYKPFLNTARLLVSVSARTAESFAAVVVATILVPYHNAVKRLPILLKLVFFALHLKSCPFPYAILARRGAKPHCRRPYGCMNAAYFLVCPMHLRKVLPKCSASVLAPTPTLRPIRRALLARTVLYGRIGRVRPGWKNRTSLIKARGV